MVRGVTGGESDVSKYLLVMLTPRVVSDIVWCSQFRSI